MLETRLNILKKFYGLYEEIISDFSFVCHKGCSVCCTRNVSVTGLEVFLVSGFLRENMAGEYFESIRRAVELPRFIPVTTTNGYAEILASDSEEPEEIIDPSWHPCPMLDSSGSCKIYEVRPFHCRCMHSVKECSATEFSELPLFVITLNNVFLQYIEHLDKNGFTGNFSDMLLWMEKPFNRHFYTDIQCESPCPDTFVKCRPIPFLLVPPEHQELIRPYLEMIVKAGSSI